MRQPAAAAVEPREGLPAPSEACQGRACSPERQRAVRRTSAGRPGRCQVAGAHVRVLAAAHLLFENAEEHRQQSKSSRSRPAPATERSRTLDDAGQPARASRASARASAGSQTCLGARAARMLRRQPAVPQRRRHTLRASPGLLGRARRHMAEARGTALPRSSLAAAATSARWRPWLKKTSAYHLKVVV